MKKILSALLAVVFAVSGYSVAAFAASADEAKTITLYDYGYEYRGELTADPVVFKATESSAADVCYKITAAESGIYNVDIKFDFYDAPGCIIGEDVEDNFTDIEKDCLVNDNNNETSEYFRMDAGEEAYVFIDTMNDTGSFEATFEYACSGIKEVTPSSVIREECFKYTEDGTNFTDLYFDYFITLENGEVFKNFSMHNTKENIDIDALDSTEVEINVLGETYTLTTPVVSINDYISSVELPEGFEPACNYDYNDDCYGENPGYITINFTDGTSVDTEPYTYINIPGLGDFDYYVLCWYNSNGTFYVNVAGYEAKFDAKVTRESTKEVMSQFISEFKSRIRLGIEWVATDIRNMFNGKADFEGLYRDARYLILAPYEEVTHLVNYIR